MFVVLFLKGLVAVHNVQVAGGAQNQTIFFGVFRFILLKEKMDFRAYSILAQKGSRGFFKLGSKPFLPNGLCLPPKQPWGSPKF